MLEALFMFQFVFDEYFFIFFSKRKDKVYWFLKPLIPLKLSNFINSHCFLSGLGFSLSFPFGWYSRNFKIWYFQYVFQIYPIYFLSCCSHIWVTVYFLFLRSCDFWSIIYSLTCFYTSPMLLKKTSINAEKVSKTWFLEEKILDKFLSQINSMILLKFSLTKSF